MKYCSVDIFWNNYEVGFRIIKFTCKACWIVSLFIAIKNKLMANSLTVFVGKLLPERHTDNKTAKKRELVKLQD